MMTKVKKRIGAVVLAVSLAAGGGALAAAPAYAGQSGTWFAGPFNASAEHDVWGGTQGLSFAKHGCKTASSGWTTSGGYAWAACGVDTGSYAYNSFR